MPRPADRLIQVAILVVLLGAWETATRTGLLDVFFFPAPSAIGMKIAEWVSDAGFLRHVSITLTETVLGYLDRHGAGHRARHRPGPQPSASHHPRPLHQGAELGAAGGAGATLRAVVRALACGRRWRWR